MDHIMHNESKTEKKDLRGYISTVNFYDLVELFNKVGGELVS